MSVWVYMSERYKKIHQVNITKICVNSFIYFIIFCLAKYAVMPFASKLVFKETTPPVRLERRRITLKDVGAT